ncbi:MAG: phospholipid carrier-dependent glycosyltransferase [Nitrospirae bacterium]|nr:phospholipid carrier-dependent glycosyltransferase [Nitrospirota bacterium]
MTAEQKNFLYAALILITLAGVFLRFWGVIEQPPIHDEVMTAYAADSYIERGQFMYVMPHHPKLRNILVDLSMNMFGRGAAGLRGFSLLFGCLSVLLLGLLLYRISSNTTASCLAAFFLAVDPMHITFSRQAIQEVHTTFFFILGTLLAVLSVRDEKEEMIWWLLPLSGIVFGLGLASKGHALFPLLVCIPYIISKTLKLKDPGLTIFAILSLTVLPLTVFLLTYIPWFDRGYDLSDWLFMQQALSKEIATHQGSSGDVFKYTQAWQWFINPLMAYGNFSYSGGKPHVTVAMGNPLVWLLVLPSSFYLLFKALKQKKGLIVLFLFWIPYLPLALALRPIQMLSSLGVIPFAFCLVGLTVSEIKMKTGAKYFYAYLTAVLLAAMLLYPLAIGKALDYGYLRSITERANPHTINQNP